MPETSISWIPKIGQRVKIPCEKTVCSENMWMFEKEINELEDPPRFAIIQFISSVGAIIQHDSKRIGWLFAYSDLEPYYE